MRKIREVLSLKFEIGLSARQVSLSFQIGRASIGEYLNRLAASGLRSPSALTDAELQRHLFPPPPTFPSDQRRRPDWAWLHAELRRPGVTLALLWQEISTRSPARLLVQLVLRALSPLDHEGRRGHRIELKGESMRRRATKLTTAGAHTNNANLRRAL